MLIFSPLTFLIYIISYNYQEITKILRKQISNTGEIVNTNLDLKILNLPYITNNINFMIQMSKLKGDNVLFDNDSIECLLLDKW